MVRLAAKLVDVVGQVAPGAGSAGHVGLSAQLAFDTHFARHGRHLIGEGRQRVGHGVDRVGQLRDFALGFEVSLRFRSPLATAVTTWAMPRTWSSGCRP